MGDAPHLVVNEREQPLHCSGLAGPKRDELARNIGVGFHTESHPQIVRKNRRWCVYQDWANEGSGWVGALRSLNKTRDVRPKADIADDIKPL
jgi:hypothetical protein